MFSHDHDSKVEEVDFSFLHPKHDRFWDWPQATDEKRVAAKYIFYGPCMPNPPTKKGFKFPDEEEAAMLYREYKKTNKIR